MLFLSLFAFKNSMYLKLKIIFLFILFISTGILSYIQLRGNSDVVISNPVVEYNESFDPSLSRLNSVSSISAYIDSIYTQRNQSLFDTATYVSVASQTIKQRFYHGLSEYTMSDNWLAWLCGKFLWSHFSAIVIPNDILKHNEGLCSQQTIVFLDILRKKNINFKTTGLGPKEGPGHFLCEVHYNGSWHLHDVNKEPQWELIYNSHKNIDYYLTYPDTLYKVYQYRMLRPEFDSLIKEYNYGDVNEFPAKKMLLFHQTTKSLTYLIPVILFLMLLKQIRTIRNSQ